MAGRRTDGGTEGGGDGGDPYDELADAALQAMIDRQRRADAAGERRREHWLSRQAAEEGTLAGVLTDLGERAEPVAVATVARRTLHGLVTTVGVDFVGLIGPTDEVLLVPLDAVTTVRAEPGGRITLGDRTVHAAATLDVTLSGFAVDRPRIVLHTWAGEAVSGDLWEVGRDLVVVRGSASGRAYVPLDAVNDLVLT